MLIQQKIGHHSPSKEDTVRQPCIHFSLTRLTQLQVFIEKAYILRPYY